MKLPIKIFNIIKYSHDFIQKIFSYVLWHLIYSSNDNSSRHFRFPGTDIITPHIPECIQIFSIRAGEMKCISNPPMYFRNIFTARKIQNNLFFLHPDFSFDFCGFPASVDWNGFSLRLSYGKSNPCLPKKADTVFFLRKRKFFRRLLACIH